MRSKVLDKSMARYLVKTELTDSEKKTVDRFKTLLRVEISFKLGYMGMFEFDHVKLYDKNDDHINAAMVNLLTTDMKHAAYLFDVHSAPTNS